ncbi:unnamed protein product [Hydatigera taeniaeformis]|uniref:PAP-associated domain-containing protein n=1 Tax=Hydatigena taeniaeformis TaxID=6205 RepID=A0A3P7FH36_HYDTA|nr:unnamed protein product [Hydatigera taeniaeformis]
MHNMEGERHLSRWHYYPPDQVELAGMCSLPHAAELTLECSCVLLVVVHSCCYSVDAVWLKEFSSKRQAYEVDMELELPWHRLQSTNRSTLGELFTGFTAYYAGFDFNQTISICSGGPSHMCTSMIEVEGFTVDFVSGDFGRGHDLEDGAYGDLISNRNGHIAL